MAVAETLISLSLGKILYVMAIGCRYRNSVANKPMSWRIACV